MYQLNSKIKGLEPYEPLEGDFKIRLDANESFLPLSQDALNVLTQAIASIPFQRYPDPMAKGVCKAFAEYYEIDANLVTAGNGSDELISVLVNSFLTKGDTVLTLSPDFSMYRFYSSLAEAQCLELKKGGNLRIDVEELIKAANESNAK